MHVDAFADAFCLIPCVRFICSSRRLCIFSMALNWSMLQLPNLEQKTFMQRMKSVPGMVYTVTN